MRFLADSVSAESHFFRFLISFSPRCVCVYFSCFAKESFYPSSLCPFHIHQALSVHYKTSRSQCKLRQTVHKVDGRVVAAHKVAHTHTHTHHTKKKYTKSKSANISAAIAPTMIALGRLTVALVGFVETFHHCFDREASRPVKTDDEPEHAAERSRIKAREAGIYVRGELGCCFVSFEPARKIDPTKPTKTNARPSKSDG